MGGVEPGCTGHVLVILLLRDKEGVGLAAGDAVPVAGAVGDQGAPKGLKVSGEILLRLINSLVGARRQETCYRTPLVPISTLFRHIQDVWSRVVLRNSIFLLSWDGDFFFYWRAKWWQNRQSRSWSSSVAGVIKRLVEIDNTASAGSSPRSHSIIYRISEGEGWRGSVPGRLVTGPGPSRSSGEGDVSRPLVDGGLDDGAVGRTGVVTGD